MSTTQTKGAILVTGASTGIGKSCALRMDSLGHRVFAGVRKQEHADQLAKEASELLVPVMLDVTNADQIEAATQTVSNTLGDAPLLGLVNNAGIGVGGPMEFLEIEQLRWQFEVNLFGQLAVTKALLPYLRRGAGRIVNIGSIAGKVTTPFMGPYCASKHALEAMTDAMRMELKPWGLWSCVVEPGAIATPIWDKAEETTQAVLSGLPEEGLTLYEPAFKKMKRVIRANAKRGISPDVVADAVEHALLSNRPKTRYLVGTDARIGSFLRWILPDNMFDSLMRKNNGLK